MLHEYYGSGNWRRLRCKTCEKRFTERHGTPFYRMHIPEETAVKIVTQVSRGGSPRGTGETAGVDQNTVMRVVKVAGEHAEAFHESMVKNLKVDQVQADEIHTFVKKGAERGEERASRRPERGRPLGQSRHGCREPAPDRPPHWHARHRRLGQGHGEAEGQLDPEAPLPLFASDEWDPTRRALELTFGTWQPVPYRGRGRPRNPVLVMPKDFMYVQVVKHRENDRVVSVDRRIAYRKPEQVQLAVERTGTTINTSFVERSNLTTRTWNNRLVRRGLGFSKKDGFLAWSLELTRVQDNFVRYHPSLSELDEPLTEAQGRPRYRHRSPAVAAGSTDHRWSWRQILHWRPS